MPSSSPPGVADGVVLEAPTGPRRVGTRETHLRGNKPTRSGPAPASARRRFWCGSTPAELRRPGHDEGGPGRAVVSDSDATPTRDIAVSDLLAGGGGRLHAVLDRERDQVTAGADVVDQLADQRGVGSRPTARTTAQPARATAGRAATDDGRRRVESSGTFPVGAPEVWTDCDQGRRHRVAARLRNPVDHPALVDSYRGNQGGLASSTTLQLVRPVARLREPVDGTL